MPKPVHQSRRTAFKEPPPAGWQPAVGDSVFLPPRSPYLLVARGRVMQMLLADYVKVEYQYGRARSNHSLHFSQLRPCR